MITVDYIVTHQHVPHPLDNEIIVRNSFNDFFNKCDRRAIIDIVKHNRPLNGIDESKYHQLQSYLRYRLLETYIIHPMYRFKNKTKCISEVVTSLLSNEQLTDFIQEHGIQSSKQYMSDATFSLYPIIQHIDNNTSMTMKNIAECIISAHFIKMKPSLISKARTISVLNQLHSTNMSFHQMLSTLSFIPVTEQVIQNIDEQVVQRYINNNLNNISCPMLFKQLKDKSNHLKMSGICDFHGYLTDKDGVIVMFVCSASSNNNTRYFIQLICQSALLFITEAKYFLDLRLFNIMYMTEQKYIIPKHLIHNFIRLLASSIK